MIDTDKYEGLIDVEGYIDYDGLDHLLAEVKRLRADSALYLACIHSSQFRDKPGSAMSKLNQMRFLQRGEEE